MTQSTEVAELPAAVLKQFADMVGIVPDFVTGGGEGMLDQIFAAESLDKLDDPWNGERKIPVGRPLFFAGISKYPSDFPGGLPYYLVVDTIMPSSGKVTQYTAGSTMVVAQLVRAMTLDEFPFAATVVETPLKDRPGQSAQHLRISADDTAYVRAELAGKKAK